MTQLQEMGREDAVEVLMCSAPLYHLTNKDQRAVTDEQAMLVDKKKSLATTQDDPEDTLALIALQPIDPIINDFSKLDCNSSQGVFETNVSPATSLVPSPIDATTDFNEIKAEILKPFVQSQTQKTSCSTSSSILTPSHKIYSSTENISMDIDKAPIIVHQESLFSSDDQISPQEDLSFHDQISMSNPSCASDRTVSPALFTLDETLPSPTAFSSIPSKSTSPPSVIQRSIKACTQGKVEFLNSCGLDNSPDITSSCTSSPNTVKMSYVLPDVASDISGKCYNDVQSNSVPESNVVASVTTTFDGTAHGVLQADQ